MSKEISVSNETWEKIKDIVRGEDATAAEPWNVSSLEDLVGQSLFIRTVTYHSVGKVERIVNGFIELSGASWVADSGRFMNAIKEGSLDEVEPVGNMLVSVSSIIDIFPWKHTLPTKQA